MRTASTHNTATAKIRVFLIRSVPFIIVVLLWWLSTSQFQLIPPYIISSPAKVIANAVELLREGTLVQAVSASIGRMVAGFVAATVCGIILGILVGTNRVFTFFLQPIAKFFQAVAGPTWIPIAMLWFGMSWYAVGFIVFNTVFFIVFYNTVTGINTVNQRLVDSVRVLGGNRWNVLKEVLIPGAIPQIITGMRLGIGYGWRALIAGEIIASGTGLGVLIWEGQRLFRIYDIVLGLVLIGIVSYIMERAMMGAIERATIRKWRMAASKV